MEESVIIYIDHLFYSIFERKIVIISLKRLILLTIQVFFELHVIDLLVDLTDIDK
jgi:hypothetical protein